MRGTSRQFLIPKGALKVREASDAVAYLYPLSNSRPAMMVFYGAQSKPAARFYYRTEAEREQAIKRHFEARQQRAAAIRERRAKTKAEVATVKFQVGKTYYDRSSSNWDTIYSFEITGRSARQLTIREHGKTYKRGIYVYDGVEHCKPYGTFSMCSVISAARESV
jgi:hypothetical protein